MYSQLVFGVARGLVFYMKAADWCKCKTADTHGSFSLPRHRRYNRRAFYFWRTLNSRGLPDMLLLVTCRPVRRGRRSSNWYRWVLCECLSQAEHAQRGVSSSLLSSSSSIEATCLVAALHFFCMPSDLWFSSDSSFSCWPRSSLTLNLLSDVLPIV